MSIELAQASAAEHLEAIRERIRARVATASDFIVYNLLRGKPAHQGFQPCVNPNSMSNGRGPYDGFLRASQQSAAYHRDAAKLPSPLADALTSRPQSELRLARVRLLCETFHRAQAQGLSKGHLRGILRWAMLATPQGGANVHEHCRLTEKRAVSLVSSRMYGSTPEWRAKTSPAWVPGWFFDCKQLTLSQAEYHLMRRYLLQHDCGKPFVYTEDEQGRAHFPNHAQASARIWGVVGGSADEQYLIEHDMDLHILKAEGLEQFAKGRFAKLQLIAALASLWANQDDFGGVESTSFKCKLKHLDRRGRALCKLWEAEPLVAAEHTQASLGAAADA